MPGVTQALARAALLRSIMLHRHLLFSLAYRLRRLSASDRCRSAQEEIWAFSVASTVVAGTTRPCNFLMSSCSERLKSSCIVKRKHGQHSTDIQKLNLSVQLHRQNKRCCECVCFPGRLCLPKLAKTKKNRRKSGTWSPSV